MYQNPQIVSQRVTLDGLKRLLTPDPTKLLPAEHPSTVLIWGQLRLRLRCDVVSNTPGSVRLRGPIGPSGRVEPQQWHRSKGNVQFLCRFNAGFPALTRLCVEGSHRQRRRGRRRSPEPCQMVSHWERDRYWRLGGACAHLWRRRGEVTLLK